MNKQLIFKIVGVVVPLVVAALGLVYGDVTPIVQDICEAALPSTVQVKTVNIRNRGNGTITVTMPQKPRDSGDAGAPR